MKIYRVPFHILPHCWTETFCRGHDFAMVRKPREIPEWTCQAKSHDLWWYRIVWLWFGIRFVWGTPN